MIQVITPKQGDQIIFSNTIASGIRYGIYHRVLGHSYGVGMKPYTRGRDQFNNSNCTHLNMEGSLFMKPTGGNVVFDNTYYLYASPNFADKTLLIPRLKVGTQYVTDIILPEEPVNRSITYYEHSVYWMKREFVYIVEWLSKTKTRVVTGVKITRVSTGAVLNSSYTAYFAEYQDTTYSKVRLVNSPAKSSIDLLPKDMTITTAYGDSIRQTLMGLDSYPSVKASMLHRSLIPWIRKLSQDDSSSFGQLSIDAVQALKVFDGQLSLLLRDIIGIKGTILSFFEGLGALSVRGLSTTYLSYRYGLKLTYTDLKALATRTRSVLDGKKGYNTSRSRLQRVINTGTFGSVKTKREYNMKLYVRDYPDWIIEALQKMMIADFFPTLELVWDAIPFSFVVDWFVSVGDYLEAIDSNTLLSTYKVLGCVFSRKDTVEAECGVLFPFLAGVAFGELRVSYYNRHIQSTPPPFMVDYSTPRSFNHYLEGSALIAQRSRV